MTLREVFLDSEQHSIRELIDHVGPQLLDRTASSYTDDYFTELREAVEGYVRTILYTSRIRYATEINKHFDTFFNGRFSQLCRLNSVLNSTEIDILLLKALQGGSNESLYANSQADRADQFGMSVNAIHSRIHALEDGKDILGHRVQIHIAGRGQTAYDNTIHPIFLTLNLQEVFLLTVRLKQVFSGTTFEKLADGIANDIYSQMSDYAKDILQPHTAGQGFETQDTKEPTAYRPEQRDIVYYLKSGDPCRLITLDGTEYTGKVEYRDNNFFLLSSSGKRIPIPDDHSAYTLLPYDQA